MARATQLILEVSPGCRVVSRCDVYPDPVVPSRLSMRLSRFDQVLGIAIPNKTVIDVLNRLGFQPEIIDGATLSVTVPTYRSDVTLADDIVEEVARIVGYDTLPSTLPYGQAVPVERDPVFQAQRAMRRLLTGSGLSEAITYVTVSEEMLEPFTDADSQGAGLLASTPVDAMLRLRNPLQAERALLRTTLIPSLLESVSANLKHSSSVGLFEFGRLYLPAGVDSLPQERDALAVVMAGSREPVSLYAHDGDFDFFDLKGVLEILLERVAEGDVRFQSATPPGLHPGRSAILTIDGERAGVLGELRPDIAARFGMDGVRIALAEIDVQTLLARREGARQEVFVPRFLPARQDFAIVVEESVAAGDVERALRDGGGLLVTDIELFDVYRGEQIGPGKKSLAFRLTFTAPDRALTDNDLVKVRKRIEKTLSKSVSGTLRG
jgi:phenylalanyl-tRNA synthetase beta chain